MLTPTLTASRLPADATLTTIAPATGRIALTAAQLAANLAGRDADTVATLEWLRHHCQSRSLSWDDAARRLHKTNGSLYSRDSVYQALSGARGAEVSLEPLCAAIERYRRNVEAPAPIDGFLETRMAREIGIYVARAQAQWKIGFIVGHNAVGKTTAIEQLERGSAKVTQCRMAEGGHLSAFLPELARKRGFGDRQTIRDLSRRIIAEFHEGDALIIDEADECFRSRGILGSKTLSFIRRIFDQAKCAVVLVMDPAGYKRLQTVQADDPLRRLYSRRLAPLFLPKFYREDLDLFAAQQGLPPAPDAPMKVTFTPEGGRQKIEHTDNPQTVQDAICSSHRDGLFVWLGLLKEAAAMARAADKDVSWGWVLKAHALFAAMESEGGK